MRKLGLDSFQGLNRDVSKIQVFYKNEQNKLKKQSEWQIMLDRFA